jgi:benzoate-CoA ligase family protein
MSPVIEPYNATSDLLERNALDPISGFDRGARPYLLTDAKVFTYAEIIARAHGAGAGLLGLGLSRGDRVILLTQDCPELVCAFWGAMKAGLIPIPVAPMLSPSDLKVILADSDARAVVFDASAERSVAAVDLGRAVPLSIHDPSVVAGVRRWSEIAKEGESIGTAPTTTTDTAFWLYTSGTTGTPKAVPHAHGSLRAAPFGLSRQVAQLGPNDVVLSASRMFFAYGLGNSVYLPAAAGASVVVSSFPVIPTSTLRLIERWSPTLVFGVPSFYSGYVQLPDATLGPRARLAFSAGEALSPTLFERFEARFGLQLLDGWGCTEAMHHLTSNRVGDAVAGSAGRPLDGFAVEVRDRDGAVVAEGTSGELWVRGPTIFSGYWQRPELTRRALERGWFRTGDVVQLRDGRLYHEGRFDDLLKLGGIWVAPREIEDVLREHRDVEDAAVVMVQNEGDLPILKAFVRSTRMEASLKAELARECRQRLASYKLPTVFEIVAELPRTPTGKVQRFELRKT